MSLKEAEAQVKELEKEIEQILRHKDPNLDTDSIRHELTRARDKTLKEAYANLTSYDRVYLARKTTRPNARDYIDALFDDFFELKGDRLAHDDASIIGGLAYFCGVPVTVIGTVKGKSLEENLSCNFGMPNPEGYRKALRLMKQAEKFGRPIITFIDTPGAYPGIAAEEHGQGEAIARNLMEMGALTVPVIAIVIGEGGSGGALALSVANQIWMLENAVYSILSPEGFAAILWKDGSRAQEACELMKLTAQDLYDFKIVERIFSEPRGDLCDNAQIVYKQIKRALQETLPELMHMTEKALVEQRYKKFRTIGDCSDNIL